MGKHNVFNLSKKSGYSPRSLGDATEITSFAHEGPTMTALVVLLADGWRGDRIAIASNVSRAGDVPGIEDLTGVYDDEAYEVLHVTEDKRLKPVGWLARKVLATTGLVDLNTEYADRGWGRRQAREYNVTRFAQDIPETFDNLDDVLVVNLDKREMLDPKEFGSDGSLFDVAVFGGDGGVTTALAALLAGSCKGGARSEGDFDSEDPLMGSWAGDRIAIVERDEFSGGTNISGACRDMLTECGEGYYTFAENGEISRLSVLSAPEGASVETSEGITPSGTRDSSGRDPYGFQHYGFLRRAASVSQWNGGTISRDYLGVA